MLYSLRGTLLCADPHMAVIECGGVGYRCQITMTTYSALPREGREARLYTHLNVREDAVELFGFAEQGELSCFKMLLTVSGVGPKAALAILSNLTQEQFVLAVAAGDVKAITRAQGVGPKLAQRILMELKDRVAGDSAGLAVGELPAQVAGLQAGAAEAVSALAALGYDQSQAAAAVAKLDQSLPAEELIKAALKAFASGR